MTSPTSSTSPTLTPHTLASLIQQLTSPNSIDFRHAEATILTHLSSPTIVNILSQLLIHPIPEVRNFSAILLRRALAQHHPKSTQSFNTQHILQPVKTHILPLLTSETNPAARRALISLSSFVCKLQNALWPQLTATAVHLSQSPDPSLRASSYSIIQSLCDTAPDLLVPHLSHVSHILSSGLSDPILSVRLAALHAFSAAANSTTQRYKALVQLFVDLLPQIFAFVKPNSKFDFCDVDEHASIISLVFDILTAIADHYSSELVPQFLTDGYVLALTVFSDHDTSLQARSSANEFLVFIITERPKVLQGNGIATTTVKDACSVALREAFRQASVSNPINDNKESGNHDPIYLSLRILYTMARRPEFSPLVFTNVLSSLQNLFKQPRFDTPASSLLQAVGYRMIIAISDGCGGELTRHIPNFFPDLVSGASDDALGSPTRALALEAVGCVCEYIDTDEMPDDLIVKIANSALDSVLTGLRHGQSNVSKAACVSLEPILALFLPGSEALQLRVGETLQALANVTMDVAEDAMLAVGVVIEHASDAFNESAMYEEVLEWIARVMRNTNEDQYLLRSAATSTAAALVASCVDHSVIEKLAQLAIVGLDSEEDPLRQATFKFFTRMADVIGGSVVAVFGPKILQAAVESMAKDSVNRHHADDPDEITFNLADDEAGDEDDDDNVGIQVGCLDEKTVAVTAVGAFASASVSDEYMTRVSQCPEIGAQVRKLLGESVVRINGLTQYFLEDVRAAAYQAFCRVAITNHILKEKHPMLAFSDLDLLSQAFPKLIVCVREEKAMEVVTSTLTSYASLVGLISAQVVNGHKNSIMTCLHLLLNNEAACEMGHDVDGGHETRMDVMDDLLDGVRELIVAMSVSLREYFARDFVSLLQSMITQMWTERSSARRKANLLGTSAAGLLYLGWKFFTGGRAENGSNVHEEILSAVDEVGEHLIEIALNAAQTAEHKSVRQNGVFLLGVIFARTQSKNSLVWQAAPQALKTIEEIIEPEKLMERDALIDYAAGALSRIIFSRGIAEANREQRSAMMRAVLRCVPVQNDCAENTTIAIAILRMAEVGWFDVLVEKEMVAPVVTCLWTTVLSYRTSTGRNYRGTQSRRVDLDVCDEIAFFDERTITRIVGVLHFIIRTIGEDEVKKVTLNVLDESIISEILTMHNNPNK